MAINLNANTLKNALNNANPLDIDDELRAMQFGSFCRSMPTWLRNQAPITATVQPQLSTLQSIVLPDDAKAQYIFRAYGRVGTATAGEFTVEAYGTTPSANQIAVGPNGDIVFLAADAWTNLDVCYLPEKADPYELILPVSSNAATIPAVYTTAGVVLLHEAQALTGTVTGSKIVLVPGTSTGTTGEARLNLAKTQVLFNSGDAVTSARVKFSVASAVDVNSLLVNTQNFI